MTNPEDRAALIKKLLHKAEAQGTTQAERDTFNAKAAELMIKWGVDDAMVASADRLIVEKIVRLVIVLPDVPKSYSFEVTSIGVQVAEVLSCRGLFQRMADGRTACLVVGFEADTQRVKTLYESLALQCILQLGPWFQRWVDQYRWAGVSGTDKFNAKRSFIRGFADGVKTKMKAAQSQVLADAKAGTDLVLVDRKQRVTGWMNENMRTGKARQRSYAPGGYDAGRASGLKANIGGSQLGGTRKQIGG